VIYCPCENVAFSEADGERGQEVASCYAAVSLSPCMEERVSTRPLGHIAPLGGDRCDFCNTSPVAKVYACENFEISGLPIFRTQFGVWASCRQCSELIEAGRWSDLAERACRKFIERHGGVARYDALAMRAQFGDIVRLFAEHRKPEA